MKKELIFKKEVLTSIKNRINHLSSTNNVKKYKELLETEEVKEYLDLLQDEKLIQDSIIRDKKAIKNNCSHNMLLINTENPNNIFDNHDGYHECTCLKCGKKLCMNLYNSIIYTTSDFKLEDIEKISKQYKELHKKGKVKNERIIIINVLKNQKVKSRKI